MLTRYAFVARIVLKKKKKKKKKLDGYLLELERNKPVGEWCHEHEPRHDKTNKVTVRPAKTQISLGIRPVWSEFSLSAWRKLGSLATHWAHGEDSDQTGRTLILLVLSCRSSLQQG